MTTRVLVFGASGYVGTNLVPCLAARGWPDTVEVVEADALAAGTLPAALEGVDVAYYLVHSMAAGPDFPRLDRVAAEHFRAAAERTGLRRIVYLGGLQPVGDASTHLASRGETGEILRAGRVAVTEVTLIAEMKLPGSASLELELRPEANGRTRVLATGYFHPAGALGLVYWYVLAPAHAVIFMGLAKAIAERAERDVAAGENVTPPRHPRGNAGDFSR